MEHPGRGAFFIARRSRRGVSPDEDPGIEGLGKDLSTPRGVAPSGDPSCSFLKKVDSVSVTLLLILLNVDF